MQTVKHKETGTQGDNYIFASIQARKNQDLTYEMRIGLGSGYFKN